MMAWLAACGVAVSAAPTILISCCLILLGMPENTS
jgi:hypothetical protein